MTDSPPVLNPSLVARVKGILVNPAAEWGIIRAEHQTIGSLFTGYAAILAAISPVCSLIAAVLYGGSVVGAVIGGVVGYILSLVGVYILGIIIEMLAPSFGGTKDRLSAMKVAVYASTATWVAGVFELLPGGLAALGIIGALYSLYLLYLGLPRVMGAPQDKALGYTAVVIIAALVIWVIIGSITGLLMVGFAASTVVAAGVL